MRVSLLTGAVAVALSLAAAGCGGGDKEATSSGSVADQGAEVFASAGCGDCHTLGEAGSTGTSGPNLDDLRPSSERIVRQVQNGGAGMPSFRDKLSAQEIRDLAVFVSATAGTATGSGPAVKPFTQDGTKLEDCEAKANKDRCYEQAFANIAYDEGPKAALDEFEQLQTKNRAVFVNCHQIAHMIGAGGLLHFDGNVAEAFADGSATCGSGYYHGLLQWKLAGVKPSEVAGIAGEVCNDPQIRSNGFKYYQCDHGLGHGLMLYAAYDLPQALGFCHGLKTNYDQTSCTGGVFMENLSSSFGLKTKWIDEKNLLYPCNSKVVRESDKLYCYLIIAQRILPAVDYSWEKTAAWCRRAERAWVDRCFESIGRSVASVTHRDPGGVRALCQRAGSGERHCIAGAVIDILNNNPTDLAAKAVCVGGKPAFRAYCFRIIGFMVGTVHADNPGQQQACRQFSATREDYAQCLGQAARR